MTDPPILSLEDVHKTYRVGTETVTALKSINLAIKHGEYVALMGSSGSGKSTTLQILGSLDLPTQGRYLVEGHDLTHATESQLAGLRNRHFGFVFQAYHLLPELTALENVALPLMYGRRPSKECLSRARGNLVKVGLEHRIHHFPQQLSGGEQQRVAIARAMVSNPAVLFGDEPTGNLSESGRDAILDLLDVFHAEGATLVLVTHDPVVGRRATRRIELRDGCIFQDDANQM